MEKHVVLVDAGMSMAGGPLARSGAHIRANHPDAPAYAFLDDRIVWSGKGSQVREETLRPLLGGPSGLKMALAEVRVGHGKADDGVVTVVYTDGDLPLAEELSNPFSRGILRITDAGCLARVEKEAEGTGFRVLPVPGEDVTGTLPLARINSMIDHILLESSETLTAFRRRLDENPAATLRNSDAAFRAAARAEQAQRLRNSLMALGSAMAHSERTVDAAAIRETWWRKLDGAIARCASISSAATDNLMDQAELQAVREMTGLLDGPHA